MSKRIIPITTNSHYHIFNRGNRKQPIFQNERDYIRLLFLILFLQAPVVFPQIGRVIDSYVKHRVFDIAPNVLNEIVKKRYVHLMAFALMPNHFHLLVYSVTETGVSQYMQRVLNSYTKYFNTKHKQVGHLFQGPYKARYIRNERQLQYTAAYIHRNPRELRAWRGKEENYPWSSYIDYVIENRWGELLMRDIVLGETSGKQYKKFVDWTGAKESHDIENFSHK